MNDIEVEGIQKIKQCCGKKAHGQRNWMSLRQKYTQTNKVGGNEGKGNVDKEIKRK